MKLLGLVLIGAALGITGCAASHSDTVMPGYYDGYHIPQLPAYYYVEPHGDVGSTASLHLNDSED